MYAPRGQAFSFVVPLILVDDTNFADVADYAPAVGDFQVIKDGGAEANIASAPTELDIGALSVAMYQISLSSAEMQADQVTVICIDAALEHNAWVIETVSGAEMWASEITSVTDNGQFIIDEGSAIADVFNGCPIMVVDSATQSSRSFGIISDYIVTTREIHTAVNLADPTTIAANDKVFIYPPIFNTGDAFARLAAPAGASVSADIAAVKVDTAAILVDTSTTLQAELDAIQVAVITNAVGADVSADIATAQADLDTITGAAGALLDSTATSAQLVDDIWDEVLTGASHNVSNSSGRRLRQLESSFVVAAGTAQAGTANTITLAAGESSTDDIFEGDRVIIVGGTGVAEHGIITTYNGTTKVATMSQNWTITPDATSEYDITPADVDIETWQHVVVSASATSGLPEVDMKSISDDATAADNLEEGATAVANFTVNDAGATTTVFIISSTEATDDHFNGKIITFITGALKFQSTDVTDYTGATKTITVTALTEAPANGDAFVFS